MKYVRNACRNFVGKPDGRRLLVNYNIKGEEDDIKMDLKDME
jgi:hypothetical protein